MPAQAEVSGNPVPALAPDIWLSERLGTAAFTLPAEADAELRPAVRPAFLQTKVDIENPSRVEALIRAGYSLVETAVTLEKSIDGVSNVGGTARFAAPADEPAVRQIAGCAFSQSRFHKDERIARRVADRIKADWAGNFFSGSRGTHMVIAQDSGRIAGFLLLIHCGKRLIIDLVAVAPPSQGRGIGRAMLDFAAEHVAGAQLYVVGTQLQNVRSLVYYNGYGFRIVRASHSLHRHLS